jgi:hypothetical protein
MFKNFAVAAVLLAPVAANAQTFQPGRLPATSRDSFEVLYQGNPIGGVVMSHARAGENVTLITVARLTEIGMTAIDSVTFNATTLAPVLFSSSQSMGPMAISGRVTVSNGKATGSVQQPTPTGIQNVTVDAAVPAGALGEGADAILIPTLDFSDGLTVNFQSFDPKAGKAKSYVLKVLGKETVTVPAGTFETWKTEVTSDDVTQVWVTTAEPRKIVMMRLGAQQVEMRRASK